MKQECEVIDVAAERQGRVMARAWIMMGVVGLGLTFAASASAQDTAPAASPAKAPAAAKSVDVVEEEPLDPSDPLYWSKVRGIETVQRREILKEGRFGITAYAGIIPNNIFEQYFPVGGRLNYFVLENLGLELSGSYALSADTGLIDTLQDGQGVGATAVQLGDRQRGHVNVGVMWTPAFGKMAWRNKSLNYFDFYLLGGAGTVFKSTQATIGSDEEEINPAVEGMLGAGMFFFLGQRMALRLDFRQFIFAKVTGGVANPSEVSLGVMFMPGGRSK